ncbi:helix-turn-helix transcriptional regulator [Aquibacillus sediminis]|uniref:helix-turn-helix transcriptional regulator n=1 Tax=Aquibacillus sediminis TaxID=2574734 RepID=UPI0011089092|nr:AraC family transcriptional regulator [Aquibacillus sediminis]
MESSSRRKLNEGIVEGHKIREQFLNAIQLCDRSMLDKYKGQILNIMKHDTLNLFKRIPENRLRSYKNFLLSHNTLYSYSAEKGGLHATTSHFMSEKYAIMIEHTDTIANLDTIHSNMIEEYMDPSIRYNQINDPTIVDKAVAYIEMNFAEEFTIEQIAHDLHVHPSHLMRSFKKEKGITISHYRNQKRVKEAKELIIHTNLSMTEIAVMVGFNNSQYFSKIFKGVEGMSPVKLKKKYMEQNEQEKYR